MKRRVKKINNIKNNEFIPTDFEIALLEALRYENEVLKVIIEEKEKHNDDLRKIYNSMLNK